MNFDKQPKQTPHYSKEDQERINAGESKGPMTSRQEILTEMREIYLARLAELGIPEEAIKSSKVLEANSYRIVVEINGQEIQTSATAKGLMPDHDDAFQINGESVGSIKRLNNSLLEGFGQKATLLKKLYEAVYLLSKLHGYKTAQEEALLLDPNHNKSEKGDISAALYSVFKEGKSEDHNQESKGIAA
jgi:hypothetical protein